MLKISCCLSFAIPIRALLEIKTTLFWVFFLYISRFMESDDEWL